MKDEIKIKKEQEKKQENRISLSFEAKFGNGEKVQKKIDLEVKYKMMDAKLSSIGNVAKNFFESNRPNESNRSISYKKALVNSSYENNNKTDLKNLVEKGKINSNNFDPPQNQR